MEVKFSKTVLTGGSSAALDGIDGSTLTDGDLAFVVAADYIYVYVVDADLGEAESSPTYIVPDTNPGSKTWVLKTIYTNSLYVNDAIIWNEKWKFDLDGNDLVLYHYDSGWVENTRFIKPT